MKAFDHFQEHIKEAHTIEDANRCPICRGLYPDREVLQKHIPLHDGKHRLQCVECNTVFTRSNGLMRHMSIHTGEKVIPKKNENQVIQHSVPTALSFSISSFTSAINVAKNSFINHRFVDTCWCMAIFETIAVRCVIKRLCKPLILKSICDPIRKRDHIIVPCARKHSHIGNENNKTHTHTATDGTNELITNFKSTDTQCWRITNLIQVLPWTMC